MVQNHGMANLACYQFQGSDEHNQIKDGEINDPCLKVRLHIHFKVNTKNHG